MQVKSISEFSKGKGSILQLQREHSGILLTFIKLPWSSICTNVPVSWVDQGGGGGRVGIQRGDYGTDPFEKQLDLKGGP